MKNQQVKSAISISIIVIMLMLVTSCGAPKSVVSSSTSSTSITAKGSSTTGSVTSAGAKTSSTATTKKVVDTVIDMKGYTFTIASGWLPTALTPTSTLFERLFFERIKQVEKDYNCKIKIIKFDGTVDLLRPYIMAGKKVADVIEVMPTYLMADLAAGYFVPWDNVKGINTKDPRWVSAYTKLGTQNGKVFGLQFLKPPEARFCVVFNKTLLKNNGINADGIYNLVRQNKWNFDVMRDYAIKTTKDTNGDGTIDTFGIAGKPDYMAVAFLNGNNARLATRQNSGKVTATFDSPASVNALNYYDNLVNKDKVVMVPDAMLSKSTYQSITDDSYWKAFNSGKVAFFVYESWVLNQYVKPTVKSFDYGMLPIPMGPNAKTYSSPAHLGRVFCVTTTNKEIDKTATIFNALAAPLQGYDKESTWWEDVQTDYFQSKDKNSIEMYKQVLNSSMVDLGVCVSNLHTSYIEDVVYKSIFWKKSTPAAAVAGIKGMFDDTLNSIYNTK